MKKTFTRSLSSTVCRVAGAGLLPLALASSACTPAAQTGDEGGSGGSSSTGSGGSGTSGSGGKSTGGGSGSGQGSGGSGASGSGGSTGGSSGGSGGSGGNTSGGASGGSAGSTGGSGGSSQAGGTTGSSGGSPGSDGGGDVPAAVGAAGCEGVTGKFCSDFEQQTAGGAPNGNGDFSVSGAVTVDGAKGFSGTKSLHYKPGGKSQIKFTKQFPFNEQYGRLMIFVAKTPPNPSHWDIVQSNSGAGNIWSWGGMYGKFELVVDPPDDGKDSKTPFPDGRWACIQWKFSQGTGGKSEYHVKLDNMEVDQSPVNGHWKAGPWKDLAVGFEVFGSAPIEFWIDDLAFGETEIACPSK